MRLCYDCICICICIIAVVSVLQRAASVSSETRVLIHYGGCETNNFGSGKCLPRDKCDFYALDALDAHAESAHCKSTSRRSLVCCPTKSDAVPRFAARNDLNVTHSAHVADELPQPPDCGTMLTDRIYNGEQTKLLEFPWAALIEYTSAAGAKGHYCGGSFIAQRWVLTAAHCALPQYMTSGSALTGVRLGEWNRTTDPDCIVPRTAQRECNEPHIDVAVDRIVAHAGFDHAQFTHDIALLRLTRAIDWLQLRHVRPICLPLERAVRDDPLTGAAVDVTGWGRTERNDEPSDIKRKAVLSVWQLEHCQRRYRMFGFSLGTAQLCASGAPGVDTCRGDSGGPLMMETNDAQRRPYFYLAGIVSFGKKRCGQENFPAVYTRVGAYIDWIMQNIELNK